MELICTRSCRNVGGKIKVEKALHPSHIEKGQAFEIGDAKTLKELHGTDERAGELAARLILAGVAAEPTPETVARIEAELEQDRKREDRNREADAVATSRAANAAFIDALTQLAALQPKAAPARAR